MKNKKRYEHYNCSPSSSAIGIVAIRVDICCIYRCIQYFTPTSAVVVVVVDEGAKIRLSSHQHKSVSFYRFIGVIGFYITIDIDID
ncbi:MAG: hypothetical protein ACI90V_008623, partial [Bacillariaceae sp.]